MNTITAIGNLATDVYTREVPGRDGTTQKVASFKLAVNRPGKDAGADFFWVQTWNGTAEACHKYLGKGHEVAVEGSLRSSRENLDDGTIKDHLNVNAQRVTFLRRPSGDSNVTVASTTEEPTPLTPDDEIPF